MASTNLFKNVLMILSVIEKMGKKYECPSAGEELIKM